MPFCLLFIFVYFLLLNVILYGDIMFDLGKPIKPREPVEVAEAPQPLDYDDIKPLEGDALKEHFLEIFRKREEESED